MWQISHTKPIVHRLTQIQIKRRSKRRDNTRKEYRSWFEYGTSLARAVVDIGCGSSHIAGEPFEVHLRA